MIDIEQHQQEVEAAVEFLRARLPLRPKVGIQLGTGLSGLADGLEVKYSIPYEEIPHFPRSTVESHAGKLVCGLLAGKPVIILQGRFHYYEGYSAREVGFPMRVLALLGVKIAIITNASGGLCKEFAPGTIMVLTDHLNFLGDNPLRGPNVDAWGPRFPDLSQPYDPHLRALALKAAADLNMADVRRGVYVCIPGPSLETPAETRWLRNSGADAVGMSSVPEVITALHGGMRVLALSVVSNVNDPDDMQPILLEDIVKTAGETEKKLFQLLLAVMKLLHRDEV